MPHLSCPSASMFLSLRHWGFPLHTVLQHGSSPAGHPLDRALCPGTIMRHLKNQREQLSALVFRGEWGLRAGRVWGSLQT